MITNDLSPAQIERFWSKVQKHWDGCWFWTGASTKPPSGGRYGSYTCQVKGRKRTTKAHRLAYMLSKGNPGSKDVLHRCDNTLCVRPSHLFTGDHVDNMRDMISKGRWKGAAANNAAKTHCDSGHELTGNNLYKHNGKRSCRECRRLATQRYRSRRRENAEV
jgi:HNH endonuclease